MLTKHFLRVYYTSQRRTRQVQSWPYIGHRSTIRNLPARQQPSVPVPYSRIWNRVIVLSSSATPKFTTSAQIGEAKRRQCRRETVGSTDPVSGSPPVPPEEAMETPPPFQESAYCDVCRCTFSTFRRRVGINSLSHPSRYFSVWRL